MDKPEYIIDRRISHRKGFALIITLSVLAIVIALTGVLINYLDEVRQDATQTKALIQGDLCYTDIRKIFKNFKKKKTLYTTLYLIPVPIVSPDGRFSMLLKCRPLANGINVNWLGLGNSQVMAGQYNEAQKIFDAIVQTYDLEDATRLQEMLLEEIGGEGKFAQKEQSRLRQKNGIISYEQFEGILSRYQFETDDLKVSSVPWKKFFVFNPLEKEPKDNVMDGDYLSAELIALLFDIDLATVKEDWIEGETKLKSFIQNNGGSYDQKLFAQKFLERSQCEVQYSYANERFKFRFIDIQGEVKNFEFYGKQ
ncbi:MAG: hypothetical protein P794_04130 [Epsilonproteobacteria bacterium (ex Lamellibrachia satsuma)]|nr:MAG: hypothetical protein P794_04130 [Epsilonproteobacteria bacterium (ex Lamellibrachia satsuma)]